MYQVTGSSLYSIDSGGNALFLGNISNDPKPVVMATDANQLIICTGGNPSAYVYTVSGGLVEISDADLLTTQSVAFLDSRFIFDQPNGYFVVSALNDGTSINSLDFAQAEALPDDIRRGLFLKSVAVPLWRNDNRDLVYKRDRAPTFGASGCVAAWYLRNLRGRFH